MKSYSVLLYRNQLEPETWYGIVPAIPAALSDGDSLTHALEMTTEALEVLLEYRLECDLPLPLDSFDLETAKENARALFDVGTELEFVVQQVKLRFEVNSVAA